MSVAIRPVPAEVAERGDPEGDGDTRASRHPVRLGHPARLGHRRVLPLGAGQRRTRPVRDPFAVPVLNLLAVVVLAALAGSLAAVPPSRRAAKLDVLRAVVAE